MRVLHLVCERFRNLAEVDLAPHPRFNIFEGRNGQGKTNLLEAVYLISTLRSFRDGRVAELIGWGEDTAKVGARLERRGIERTVELEITKKGKRAILDGKPVRRLSASAGHFAVVLFGPDDLSLTKEGPALRRKFLDRAVYNIWPAFLDEARAYMQALKSRNALLREAQGRAPDKALMASFDDELVRRGARVLWRRLGFLETFRPLFVSVLDDMTDGGLKGSITYRGTGDIAGGASESDLADALRADLERTRDTDLSRGYTTSGPHTHDLKFTLTGRSVRRYASQGQHRAFVLALKIAELVRIEQELGVFPVLLLDDVSSELDRERNALLMSYLDTAGGQVFITTTDRSWIHVQESSRVFRVSGGTIAPA